MILPKPPKKSDANLKMVKSDTKLFVLLYKLNSVTYSVESLVFKDRNHLFFFINLIFSIGELAEATIMTLWHCKSGKLFLDAHKSVQINCKMIFMVSLHLLLLALHVHHHPNICWISYAKKEMWQYVKVTCSQENAKKECVVLKVPFDGSKFK